MVFRNIGGGNEGEGGPLSDAASLDVTNRNDNRSEADYGLRPNVVESLPIRNPTTTTADDFSTSQFLFQAELDDRITVHSFDANGEGTVNIIIAKPGELRVTIDDKVLADGTVISRVSANRRKITKGTLEYFEVVSPAYALDDLIYASITPATGIVGVTLIDLNTAARRWVPEEPKEQWFIVLDVNKDSLSCRRWDWATGAAIIPDPDTGPIDVAKPIELRGTEWEGLVIAGVTYASTDGTAEVDGHITRNGDDGATDENQEIIPVYQEGVTTGSKILGERSDTGTGAIRSAVELLWQDKNQGARAWSQEA